MPCPGVAEGDFVVTHSNLHLAPGDRGMAVADFWRLEDDRIVEHWDVIQEVPEQASNDNTMFSGIAPPPPRVPASLPSCFRRAC